MKGTNFENKVVSTIENVLPAVVSIIVAKDLEILKSEIPYYFNLFGMPIYKEDVERQLDNVSYDEKGRVELGGGSGFMVEEDGLVLTNKHVVVDPNASYSVVDSKGAKYEASVLARDPINDIAILKINAKGMPTVLLDETNNLKLGQTVIAIGNALGQFQNSVSTGIISGLSRFITALTDIGGHQERLRGLIQTDAAINPGNSGGPLVNLEGKAIGINSAVVTGAQNIGFAIPITQVKRDLESIKKFGRIRRPFLGVRYLILNRKIKEKLNLPLEHGALVINERIPGDFAVIPGSPAHEAGIQEFDIITNCNKEQIDEKKTLEDIMLNYDVGDQITITILRNGQTFDKTIILKEFQKV